VFVSHDRYFIDKLATRVFEVENGRVHVYPGNYEDYLWRKAGGGAIPAETVDVSAAAPPPVNPPAGAPAAKSVTASIAAPPPAPRTGTGRLNPIKLRQMKERRREIEEEVTRMEAEIADYEAGLVNFVSVEETRLLTELLTTRRGDLDALMSEWEQVMEAIESNS